MDDRQTFMLCHEGRKWHWVNLTFLEALDTATKTIGQLTDSLIGNREAFSEADELLKRLTAAIK